ncbi:hypothetical protein [Enterovirga sp.]|uniref:hypothetical protein n=1 Tax=Enterovirga sp. TaxID=2026350 RepID=UPI002602E1E3|nr:hypothetical protein [Enterovirga sp.]
MKRTSGGTSAALKSAGTGSDVMNGKLAKAPAGPASAEDKLFKNALPAGGSVSNALKANTSGSNDTSGSVNAFAGAALLGPANVGNALGAERSNVTNQRLGK